MTFGEEYRPVKLERYCYGYPQSHKENDFQFDLRLNNMYIRYGKAKSQLTRSRLMDTIVQHSSSRPTLIFCSTRNAVQQAAQSIVAQYDALQKANATIPWTQHHKALGSFNNSTLEGKSLSQVG